MALSREVPVVEPVYLATSWPLPEEASTIMRRHEGDEGRHVRRPLSARRACGRRLPPHRQQPAVAQVGCATQRGLGLGRSTGIVVGCGTMRGIWTAPCVAVWRYTRTESRLASVGEDWSAAGA